MEYPNGSQRLSRYQGYIRAAHRARSAEMYRLAGLAKRGLLALPRTAIAAGMRGLRWLDGKRQVRVAQRELERMDDHLLDDLGITRADIAEVVRNGKPAAQPESVGEPRHPHEAKRAAEVVDLRHQRDLIGALIGHGPWGRYSGHERKRNDAA